MPALDANGNTNGNINGIINGNVNAIINGNIDGDVNNVGANVRGAGGRRRYKGVGAVAGLGVGVFAA